MEKSSPREPTRNFESHPDRWRIEDYHKAWKSGVGVERQRFQSPENLERMVAITVFLTVPLLQLRESQSQEAAPCDRGFADTKRTGRPGLGHHLARLVSLARARQGLPTVNLFCPVSH